MMSSFARGQLQIKTKTWSRDSYGLYDYETSTLNIQNLTLSGPCDLSRKDNEINPVNPHAVTSNDKRETIVDLKEGPTALATIYETADGIKIAPTTKEKGGPDDFWFIVERGENVDGYRLKVNDVIRIGRVGFKISQIKLVETHVGLSNPNLPQKSIISTIKEHMKDGKNDELPKEAERKTSDSTATCKICLSDTEEHDNPLISPCKCTGSVRYVHLECMQNWIKSKLNMQQNKNIITIYWKNLYCELCKVKLPINVIHNDEELSLIPIGNKITGSYVIMESFSKENDSTGIHLVDLSANQNFKMGRGHDCDLKIHDISVSRLHALLVVSKGNLYLKDNLSKFGTLVLQRGPVVINEEMPVSPWIQCGRTIFKFTLKQTWLARLPCVGSIFGFNKAVKFEEKILDETDRGDKGIQFSRDGEEMRKINTRENE